MPLGQREWDTMSIGRNSAYNVLGAAAPLLLALVTIPIYLELVGAARYGALAIAWLILGYFGMFDMGFGRATTQRLSALHASTPEHRARVFWTAAVVNFALGVVGAALLYFSADYFFRYQFKADLLVKNEMLDAVPFLALSVPIATLTGVMSGALQGRERFLEVNLVNVIGTSLFQIFPLAVAFFNGPTIKWLIIAAVVGRLAGLALFFRSTFKHMLRGFRPVFDVDEWRGLLKFGSWVSLTMVIGPALLAVDRLLIGSILGGLAVATYVIAFDIAQRSSLLPKAVAQAIFPRIAQSSDEQSGLLMNTSLKVLNLVMTPIIMVALFVIGPFLELWVGPETGQAAAPLCRVLLVAYWINAFAMIPYARLQAQGRPNVVAWITMGQAPLYIAALYLVVGSYGLTGVAWVVLARCLIEVFVMLYFASWRVLIPGFFIANLCVLAIALQIAERASFLRIQGMMAMALLSLASVALSWLLMGQSTRDILLAATHDALSKVTMSRKG